MNATESSMRAPPSLLKRPTLSIGVALFGLIGTVIAHAFFALVLIFATILMASEDAEENPADEAPPPQMNFVSAELVKLGRPLEARELPNRRVPQRSTAPSENTRGLSKNTRPPPDAGPRPPDSVEDLLTRLGTSAETQARLQQIYDQEGNLQGTEGGTSDEGQVYAGVLYNFFRRGWTVPPTIAEEELRALSAQVEVTISPEGQITAFQIVSPSGNDDFDLSVRQRLDNAIGAQLPEPPEDERALFWGQNVRFRPHGRHAR